LLSGSATTIISCNGPLSWSARPGCCLVWPSPLNPEPPARCHQTVRPASAWHTAEDQLLIPLSEPPWCPVYGEQPADVLQGVFAPFAVGPCSFDGGGVRPDRDLRHSRSIPRTRVPDVVEIPSVVRAPRAAFPPDHPHGPKHEGCSSTGPAYPARPVQDDSTGVDARSLTTSPGSGVSPGHVGDHRWRRRVTTEANAIST